MEIILVASITPHLGGTTEEQPIQQQVESHVRSGRTLSQMTMTSLMWVITASAAILVEVVRFKSGAWPMTPVWNMTSVQFPFAHL